MTREKAHGSDEVISPETSLTMGITTQKHTMSLRLVTFNIRYATNSPDEGECPWDVRCPKLCNQLRFITAGQDSPFLCLQEVLYSQIVDIDSSLGDAWSYIGRGRDQDEKEGEFSAIFYRADVWDCVKTETRWLSKTPWKPSRGWDADLNRIVTIGDFEHKVTKTRVVIMCTHFDHIGVKAREHSAGLLIQFAKEWASDPHTVRSAVLVGGDFNSSPEGRAYKTIVAPESGMSDVSDLLPEALHHGNKLTFTGFDDPDESGSRIDFLFVKEPRTARITNFGVLSNIFDDRIRISDHRPVVADMDIVV